MRNTIQSIGESWVNMQKQNLRAVIIVEYYRCVFIRCFATGFHSAVCDLRGVAAQGSLLFVPHFRKRHHERRLFVCWPSTANLIPYYNILYYPRIYLFSK